VLLYTRYVDDVLVIYDSTRTNTQQLNEQFNIIHKNMEFKATPEENKAIHFLDLTITRKHNKLTVDIGQENNMHRHDNRLLLKPPHVA
jgi:hypothetical protein